MPRSQPIDQMDSKIGCDFLVPKTGLRKVRRGSSTLKSCVVEDFNFEHEPPQSNRKVEILNNHKKLTVSLQIMLNASLMTKYKDPSQIPFIG
jgi:hypothetical protein